MGWQAERLGEGLKADGRRAVEGMATRVQRRGRREGDGVVGTMHLRGTDRGAAPSLGDGGAAPSVDGGAATSRDGGAAPSGDGGGGASPGDVAVPLLGRRRGESTPPGDEWDDLEHEWEMSYNRVDDIKNCKLALEAAALQSWPPYVTYREGESLRKK